MPEHINGANFTLLSAEEVKLKDWSKSDVYSDVLVLPGEDLQNPMHFLIGWDYADTQPVRWREFKITLPIENAEQLKEARNAYYFLEQKRIT